MTALPRKDGGALASVCCGNAACLRFRDFTVSPLDLALVPEGVTAEDLSAALACSSCGRRQAVIVIAPSRFVGRETMGRLWQGYRADDFRWDATLASPLVAAALAAFPGAEIVAVRERRVAAEAEAA